MAINCLGMCGSDVAAGGAMVCCRYIVGLVCIYGGRTRIHPSFFFFQAEDGIRDLTVTGVQTCALPIFEIPRRIGALIVGVGELAFGIVEETIAPSVFLRVGGSIPAFLERRDPVSTVPDRKSVV